MYPYCCTGTAGIGQTSYPLNIVHNVPLLLYSHHRHLTNQLSPKQSTQMYPYCCTAITGIGQTSYLLNRVHKCTHTVVQALQALDKPVIP